MHQQIGQLRKEKNRLNIPTPAMFIPDNQEQIFFILKQKNRKQESKPLQGESVHEGT